MNSKPSIDFNQTISTLIENMMRAWNLGDLALMAELMEEDVVVYIEAVTIGRIQIRAEKIEGLENVLNYIKKITKKLPLRYTVEYDKNSTTKNIRYRKFFYEIKAWANFDSVISKYGRFKEFKIGAYENIHAEKLTTMYVVKNVISHKLKTFLKV